MQIDVNLTKVNIPTILRKLDYEDIGRYYDIFIKNKLLYLLILIATKEQHFLRSNRRVTN